ncbi:MAG: septum formation protein Maf [Dehalococcoidia bacterium]|nr:septum formation protein Maf [Dehalococcoidia bacterium]MYA52315.1 septum formation protein Maf [Dehalococcoidia bacterium]
MPAPVVLASASPRRHELLRALLDEFVVEAAGIDERTTDDPRADARRLAREKASAVARRHPGAVVIGADTIVHDGERAYGKPGDPETAIAMLRALRGRTHLVATGIAIVSASGAASAVSSSQVTLVDLSDDALAAYVESDRPLDKAGAYAIQDEDVPTVSALDGCYCSVMGLPLWRLRALLATAGVVADEPHHALPRCEGCPER